MASKAKIAANQRRKGVVARFAARRAELKEQVRTGTPEQREAARRGIRALPRHASPVRVRNRDAIDGRPRGCLRKAGVSRVRFRKLAHAGELPGITKSCW